MDFFCFVFTLNSEKQEMKGFIICDSYSCEVSFSRKNLLQILRIQCTIFYFFIFYMKGVQTLTSDATSHYLLNFINKTTIMLLNRSCRILWTVPDLGIWRSSSRRNESMPQHVSNIQPGRRMWICVLVLKFSFPQCSIHSLPRQVFAPAIMCFSFLFWWVIRTLFYTGTLSFSSLELIACLLYITETATKKIGNNNH